MSQTKRLAQIAMLQACAHYSASRIWIAPVAYPNCAWDPVEAGLIRPDKTITLAGRAALFLLDEAPDPFPSYSERRTLFPN